MLATSAILTAIFYSRLPEQVAYHFSGDTPDRWAGHSVFVTWTLIAQLILAGAAFGFVRVLLASARYWSVESPALGKLLPVMGNIVALPQFIILFAMLDVFLYNSYQVKLIPVLAFAIIIVALGGAVLGVVLMRAYLQARHLYGNSHRE